MTATAHPPVALPARAARLRRVAAVIAGSAIAVLASTVVVAAAVDAGAPASWTPFSPFVYGAFCVVGVVVGHLGWATVQRRARRPERVLAVLVPVVAALSFVPDVALETLRFIPGTTSTGVLALSLMHVVVLGVVIPLSAILSARGRSADR